MTSNSCGRPAELSAACTKRRGLLLALGDLITGWLLGRQAEAALARLDADDLSAGDKAFYQGKMAAAGFFAATVLPRLSAEREIAEATSMDAMELPDEAF